MSNQATDVPYKAYVPRRQRSLRPDRPLPPPPPADDAIDVVAEDAFERVQGYRSPPSPPRRVTSLRVVDKDLPPPPPPPSAPLDKTQGQQYATSSVQLPNSAPLVGSSTAQTSDAHLHPYHSMFPTASDPPTVLTPLRAHYLKKTLVNFQITHELTLMTDRVLGANALGLLGDPFVLPEQARKDALKRASEIAGVEGQVVDLPLMRFMFHQFLLPFPFLAAAPPTFWSAKVQPFVSSFLSTTGIQQMSTQSDAERMVSESLMSKEELHEVQERAKMWTKMEKHLALMFGLGIKLASGEEVVRIGQSELRRLEELGEERKRKYMEKHGGKTPGEVSDVGFDVNVIGVRVVVEKGRVRNRSHEEFIIRTSRTGAPDVFVSRRYGDFRRLAEELRLAFPDAMIPFPPSKDKTTTTAPVPVSPGYGTYNPLRVIYGSGAPAAASGQDQDVSASTPLSREKNRLTLRAYITSLLTSIFIIESPILRSFLLSGPTSLSPPEAVDCQRRLEADAVREEGRRRFKVEAEKRIEALRDGLAQFKGEVISKEGGLKGVFDVVKRVERVEDLPKAEASVLEWGRISLAATIFQLFVAADTSSETLSSLKRLHGLMPYFVLKGILKISNPMAMIRGVLDLFLARPFGGQSLIQRMFSSSLSEDVKSLEEDIEVVKEKIDDPVLCEKIEQYAKAPFEVQDGFRKDAAIERLDLLVVILRSPHMPSLSRPQFQRVVRATRAYKMHQAQQVQRMADGDAEESDDEGPEDEDAWLYEDLTILLKLWMRKREKEGLLALIFEGVTAELLKDIITIFYTPLAQVYKAASIADSLGDLQAFINDMIRTVEQVEELSQEDPGRTVQTFIDLVQRHEQAFYTFVHNVHSKGQGLFDSLMSWLELFLNYARSGLGTDMDLEFILPQGEEERKVLMKEVDAVAGYHYRLKVAHEEKIRRRFRSAETGIASGGIGEGMEDDSELLSSVMASLSIDQNAIGDAGDLADEESEEEEEEEERELADLDEEEEGEEGRSDDDSLQSRPVPAAYPTVTLSPPPLGKNEKSRRKGSHSSATGSLRKVRSALKRQHNDEKSPASPSMSSRSSRDREHTHGRHGKKKKQDVAHLLVQPETKTIGSLRPIFVEMLRPNLVVRPLK